VNPDKIPGVSACGPETRTAFDQFPEAPALGGERVSDMLWSVV
jgi:hypothetical protein